MKQIRRNVFETNSSSTHSMVIRHNGLENNKMPIDEDGYIHTQMGEFGWEVVNYTEQSDRLSYLVTMFGVKNGMEGWWRDNDSSIEEKVDALMENPWFKEFSEEIARHAHCKGLIIDPSDGYIDHQSHDSYRSVDEFLDDWGTDAVEFVFGAGNIVHTDNDNH